MVARDPDYYKKWMAKNPDYKKKWLDEHPDYERARLERAERLKFSKHTVCLLADDEKSEIL